MRAGGRHAVALGLLAAAACSPVAHPGPQEAAALGGLAAEVDQDSLMAALTALVGDHQADSALPCGDLRADLYPQLCHLSNQRSGERMIQQLQSLGLTVSRQETADPRFPTSNIIAELPGVTHPEEVVMVGAHFDAFYTGADDNSSGAAAVLELARVLSRHRFDRTVRFVGFDLEEFVLVGSGRYVKTLGDEKLVATIVFDCIGYYSSEPGSQRTLPGLPSPTTGDFLAVIANDTSKPLAAELYAINNALSLTKVVPLLSPGEGSASLLGDLMLSDHTSFWLTGRPALFLTDTAFFRNPNYHRDTDTLDTIDRDGFTRSVRLTAAGLGYWAGLR